ncbi:ribonuclease III [Actinomycetospora rhizophila]|uniref:Ribonuclease 3 n=1 Tax=Actinomycetospora rhizophila TaxID=1416876 RepID=A0ABV9ZLJ3_9PSEU
MTASSTQPAENPTEPTLGEVLGVDLDPELVELALTHRSYAYEHGGLPTNERLEFLGDAVLGVVVTERLYREHPDLPEGQLAKLRASVVNMHALAGVARELGLGDRLHLGRGEEMTGGRDKPSILGDAVEAVLGAVHLQHGIEVSRRVVERLFGELLRTAPLLGAGLDWKTSLQELTAASDLGVPEYRMVDEGPDHLKTFTATVVVAGQERGTGVGRTKKEAEQKAARAAYQYLDGSDGTPAGGA